MRKIIMIVLSFLMILNIPMSHAHADNTVEQILDNYTYEIFENDEKRFVDVINKETKHVDYIIYDKTTGVLTINGEVQDCVVITTQPNGARSVSNAATCKIYFGVTFKTIGVLAGAILAIATVASAASTCGVSVALFKAAVSQISKAYSYGSLAAYLMPGAKVKGYFKYTLQRNSNVSSRYANRGLTMKFGSGPNKSYSFGNGGWWSSTKPYSMDD